MNALIESNRVEVIKGEIQNTLVESPGGSGQRFARCPKCNIAIWSEYLVMTGGIEDLVYFIRVGTLDKPEVFPPDVHIYTSTKQPWLVLPPDALAVDEYYETDATWRPDSLRRRAVFRERISKNLP